IDNTFLSGVTTGKHWQEGDLNYDGVVDFNDYNVMDNTWLAHAGQTLSGTGPLGVGVDLGGVDLAGGVDLGGGMPAPAPEPATLALVALGGLALLVRRRP
ncbi:MAG: PEP-CTERM sorting domain-containing protein, partial [Planctomycetes bacterium]|nr:PEP-CTERM sorting domain-containing protein [Planctomycetota bacterium]